MGMLVVMAIIAVVVVVVWLWQWVIRNDPTDRFNS
jgi:cyanate permease